MWRTLFIASMFVTIGAAFAPARAASSSASAAPLAPQRAALVIGNAGYDRHPLPGAARDADDIGKALASLGFEVTRRVDLNAGALRRAIDDFASRLGPRDTALVYFAGHGVQVGGDALLLPLDAPAGAPAQLVAKGVAAREIVERMARARPGGANVVVLDMCLSEPFEKTAPAAWRLPPRTLVAYAAAPGEEAGESGRNGRYTAALLHAFGERSVVSASTFNGAAAQVATLTHQAQQPWIRSSLEQGFAIGAVSDSLHVAASTATYAADSATDETVRTRGILPKDSNEQYELAFWDSIKDSTFPSDYEAYLKAYPNGRFAALAKARIERLHAAGSAKPSAPAPAAPPTAPSAATATPAAPAPKPTPAAPTTPTTAAAPEKPRPSASTAAPAPSPAPAATAAAAAASARPAARTAGGEIKDCPACPALIAITPGSFTMGSNNDDPAEKPPHKVSIGHAYAIGKNEVTVEQWNACADAGACTRIAPEGEPGANAPMRNVSWDDAQVYVKWLSKVGGKPYRLPTEAEWEYAARGGTQTVYWWGDQMKKGNADCKDCGEPYRADAPTPVGSFAANPYGLHDMNGSVWEWVADCWHGSYKSAPADGRAWDEPSCSVRVIRGGSWREGASYMQSATRFKYSASVRQSQNGFRVAREME